MDYEQFQKIKPQLTAKLAEALYEKLVEMGEDAKGISWFSSVAEDYNKARNGEV